MNKLFGKQTKMFDEIDKKSFDVDQDRVEKLKELFPNIVSDGKVDWKALKLLLGENITEDDERYRFTWSGKSKAIRETSIPTASTLRPDKESSKNWDETENLYIEGDNLEVLKVLQNSYNGKIKMIYIDPPYNMGEDLIYKDNFTLSVEEAEKQEGLKDKKGVVKTVDGLTKNSKESAKYHTNWLNMMYPRLSIARDLLTDDGVILISIDDNEVDNLKKICDELFGSNNFIGKISWFKSYGKNESNFLSNNIEYILLYSKNYNYLIENDYHFLVEKEGFNEVKEIIEKGLSKKQNGEEIEKRVREFYNKNKNLKGITAYNKFDEKEEKMWSTVSMEKPKDPCYYYDVIHPVTGKPCKIPKKGWRMPKETMNKLLEKNLVVFGQNEESTPRRKYYLDDVKFEKPKNFISNSSQGGSEIQTLFENNAVFDYPKHSSVIKYLINLYKEKDYLSLDFFSGSATTAHAVMQLNTEDGGNRKFVMVQIPELTYEGKKDKNGEYIIDSKTNLPEIKKDSEARKAGYNYITEIGKERIRRAGEKILSDNPDKDLSNLDIGFKTFKIDSSNFNEWDVSYEAMKKSIIDSANGEFTTYKEDRTELDLVYEILLKEGYQLTEIVEEVEVDNGTLYKIADGIMYIFLGKLTENTTNTIVEMKNEAEELLGIENPTVILNEAYLDTEIKSNAKKNFEANGILDIKTL